MTTNWPDWGSYGDLYKCPEEIHYGGYLDSHAEIFDGPIALTNEWIASNVAAMVLGEESDANIEVLTRVYQISGFKDFFFRQRNMIEKYLF